jgi:hypothetical protein
MADKILLLQCGNCDRIWDENEVITPIPNLESRVSPGEPMPYGECPGPGEESCGALCHEYEGDYITECPIDDCEKGQIKLVYVEASCDALVSKDGWDLATGHMDTSSERFRCTVHGTLPSEWVFKAMSRKEAASKMQVKDAT